MGVSTEEIIIAKNMVGYIPTLFTLVFIGYCMYYFSNPRSNRDSNLIPTSFDEAFHRFKETLGYNVDWEIRAYNDSKSLIACLRNPESTEWILSTSGIHGVEGYTGSAIQTALVKEINAMPASVRENSPNIMLVHGMNPYGMKYMLRVNASNVDLNRNNITDETIFESDFKFTRDMPVLDRLMNPTTLAEYYMMPYLLVVAFVKYGMARCTQGVVTGQYSDRMQMSYGGKCHQPELVRFFREVGDLMQSGDTVYHMDIHTGYGKYMNEYLMVGTPDDKTHANAVLDDPLINYYVNTEEKHYEHLHGGLTAGFEGMLHKYGGIRLKSYLGIVQEFGTVNYSGIPIFLSMRSMNFWKNYYLTTKPRQELADASYELFNPNTPEYHELIFRRGVERFMALLTRMSVK